MADARPRIHIWPDRSRGSTFVEWSIGPRGPRSLVRSAGVGVDQALQQIGGAPGGAIIVIEVGAVPRPIEGVAGGFLSEMMGKRDG